MTTCGSYSDVLEEHPSRAAGFSTSPDPLSRRTKPSMFAANPYMPPNCFGACLHTESANRADDIVSHIPSASMLDGTFVAGVASLLALRDQQAQACARPSIDNQAKRDQGERAWIESRGASARACSNELQQIATMCFANSDELLEGEGQDADFDLLSLLCSPSEPVLPFSHAKSKHADGNDTPKFRALAQQRQPSWSHPLTHPSSVPCARLSSNELQSIAPMSYSNADELLEGEGQDADFDLLSLLCSLSELVLPLSATTSKHAFGDDTENFPLSSQQCQPNLSQPLTHPPSVSACSPNAPQIPAAPKCGRPNGRRRPHAEVGIFQQGQP